MFVACLFLGILAAGVLATSGRALAQDVRITEFLALNTDGVEDEDGDPSDWIELQNLSDAPVSLDGWALTDTRADLFRWTFPDVTLAPREFVVVFASGKDRSVAGSELHASFSLDGEGEYLALVRPDGSIAHEYAPSFPKQRNNISYGIAQAVDASSLVAQGASVRYVVPSDGALDGVWMEPELDDASWAIGPMPIGFDRGAGGIDVGGDGPVNLAPGGSVRQSSQLGGFSAENAIDGDYSNFTHTLAGTNLPAWWEGDLGDEAAIFEIVLHNRVACCESRLRDVTVFVLDEADGEILYESPLLNPENVLGGGGTSGPPVLVVDLIEELGGPVVGRVVRIERTPDPDLSGTGGEGNPDEPDVLSLGEVEVFGGPPGFGSEIESDVEDDMAEGRT
ncbi:MAG TPA: lamin tail domain-containing protein, partial [Planctomycetota bacterium]|nr:lamin tail domain-containing protein [Planctomycetota bacterium]